MWKDDVKLIDTERGTVVGEFKVVAHCLFPLIVRFLVHFTILSMAQLAWLQLAWLQLAWFV